MNKRTAVTTATLIAAAAFPSLAQGRPAEPMRAAPTPSAVASRLHAEPAPSGDGGTTFEWGDAGIGAAGAAALMAAGTATAVARRRRAARVVG